MHQSADPKLFDASAFDAGLQGPDLGLFRTGLREATRRLKDRFFAGTPAADIVAQRAWLVDQLVGRAWAQLLPAGAEDIALIAVGGYGRGELHPGSDIDLMILLEDEAVGRYDAAIERFLVFLWDIGLEVGHSVRTVADCVHQAMADITIATNLMEARLLAGPMGLYSAMRAATGPDRIWPSRQFFEAKWQEQIARHRRFNDTAYNLEPNIKEGPGGLRDIQMIGWVAKRHFGAETLHDLVDHRFLTETEHRLLAEGQEFLWRIRIALHILAGRREDRLLFDHQRTLARQFGHQDDEHHLAVEQFMKRYYRTVMELGRLNDMLLQLFQEEILYAHDLGEAVPINKRFQARKGFVETVDDKVFKRYPFALLEIFLILQQNPELKGIRAGTIRQIRNHRQLIDERFCADLRCRSLFMEILRQSHGVTQQLRRMNRYGVLAEYLPVFGRIVGQMQHDLFHVYTVDEHTLFVIRNLRRFAFPDFAHEFPLCSSIFARIPKPELLYLAALFHDIAKGRGGDHSTLGAKDAETFCAQHGLSSYDTHLVTWLVEHHLLMSTTAQRKDLSDPNVINAFAETAGSQARLDYLYLLTVADIRATSPTVWNSWKDALLMELYQAAQRALRHGLENPLDQAERVQDNQEQALQALKQHGVDEDQVRALWRKFTPDYFLRHAPDEVVWHARAILAAKPGDLPLMLIHPQTRRGGTEIFLYAPVQDLLFALTTATLERLDLTVADALIITSRDGYTLDTFIVLEAAGTPITNPHRIEEIRIALKKHLSPPQVIPRVSQHLPRRLKHFTIPTEVSFRQDAHNRRTIMEVVTTDRPGVLARIGLALVECGVRLQNAKIATFGERVEDIFFITDTGNQPLSDPQQFEALRRAITRYLEAQPPV